MKKYFEHIRKIFHFSYTRFVFVLLNHDFLLRKHHRLKFLKIQLSYVFFFSRKEIILSRFRFLSMKSEMNITLRCLMYYKAAKDYSLTVWQKGSAFLLLYIIFQKNYFNVLTIFEKYVIFAYLRFSQINKSLYKCHFVNKYAWLKCKVKNE